MNPPELYLVVSETTKSEVETALEQTDLSIKFNTVTVPCDAEDRGTADSLRFMAPYITVSIYRHFSFIYVTVE